MTGLRTPLAAFAALACVATAQVPPSDACGAPEHRQFDFWIGEWDVADAAGKPAGQNRITAIHGGCALREEWQGRGGVTGSSLNVYDRERKRWHQTWVDSGGGLLVLEGAFAGGAMMLSGASTDASGNRTLQRIRWQVQPDGRVRQQWEASAGDGREWKLVFDGWYTKRP
jgi:hypothetical protein